MSKPGKSKEKTTGINRKTLMIVVAVAAIVIVVGIASIMLVKPTAAIGDKVAVFYTGTLDDGTEFDSNMNGTPLNLTLGSHQIIPGFEEALVGMTKDQVKKVTLPVDEAYGPYRPELIHTVNRTGAIANTSFEVGNYYMIHRASDNAESMIKVLNVTPATVTWDENNPLAGQNLTFILKVAGITKGNGVPVSPTPAFD
jgi:peptidylprolyl isomerase